MAAVNWTTILLAALTAAVFGTLAVLVQKWAEQPPRPFLVKQGSVIGEFLIAYCEKQGCDLDSVCLVAHEIDEETTVFHIKSLDLFPEVWLGDD